MADHTPAPATPIGEHAANQRIAALEAAVLDLLERVQHIEAERQDRAFAVAMRDMAERRMQ